ncbi:MAG: ChbG/HpnK family deacetylase, partial [Flavobacteriaceae bacterium]|nr:ChbG/HpnK family deacetylase [Flavobacteriaceae bacterium]
SSRDSVRSLLNSQGYFYATVDSTARLGKPEEVERELRKQVNKAYRAGIDVTHLDAHMGAALSTPDFIAAYMRVAKEFRLPQLLPKSIQQSDHPAIRELLDQNTILMDGIHTVTPEDYRKGPEKYYDRLLRELPPGLHCLLIHLAYDDEEMQAITVDHPDWGASWRQADYDYFTSDAFRSLLQEEDIILVTYRELRDKISRAE